MSSEVLALAASMHRAGVQSYRRSRVKLILGRAAQHRAPGGAHMRTDPHSRAATRARVGRPPRRPPTQLEQEVLMIKSDRSFTAGSTDNREDLSATAPLPPGTFKTSAHSDEWKIANALSAGPASITDHATVIDWPANPKDGMAHGRVLRQGTNGWTCMPDVPGRPQHDPMCVDET